MICEYCEFLEHNRFESFEVVTLPKHSGSFHFSKYLLTTLLLSFDFRISKLNIEEFDDGEREGLFKTDLIP